MLRRKSDVSEVRRVSARYADVSEEKMDESGDVVSRKFRSELPVLTNQSIIEHYI